MSNATQVERLDSQALGRILSIVGNGNTGFGTSRDKSTSGWRINPTYSLREAELQELFRGSKLLQRIVTTYPLDCKLDWMNIQTPDNPDLALDIESYFEDLEFDGDGESIGQLHGSPCPQWQYFYH